MIAAAAGVLALTAGLSWLNARWLRWPATIAVMGLSMAGALALLALDVAGVTSAPLATMRSALATIDFSALLLQGLLSMLLFAGALHVDVDALRARRWQVAALAFVGTAASTAIVGGGLWLALGALGVAMPLAFCLLFGALISPTDPIAVIAMLKSAGAPRELEAVIAGESLFNDGVGVVIFGALLGWAVAGDAPTLAHAGLSLLREAGGGLLFGWAMGRAMAWSLARLDAAVAQAAFTLAAVVGGYALANAWHLSGPLAMVVAGLLVGDARRASAHDALARFWSRVDDALNAMLFTLVGLEVWVVRGVSAGACVAAIGITLAARWLTVGLPVVVAPRAFRLPHGAAGVLTWGGLRGGISLAMALAVPAGPWRDALVGLTYAVVAFAILAQGATFGRLVRATVRPIVAEHGGS